MFTNKRCSFSEKLNSQEAAIGTAEIILEVSDPQVAYWHAL